MKHHFWVAVAVSSALWQPSFALADVTPGNLPMMPQSSAGQSAGPGHFLPRADPTLPSRRVPGMAPPPSEGSPVTPDEAWPNLEPLTTPEPSSLTSDAEKSGTGNTLFNEDPLNIKGPVDGIGEGDTTDGK